jgi:predicted transcriptional regulator
MQGYIKLHREIMDNALYFAERFTKMQAWIDLLLLANHKPGEFFIRGNRVVLKRDELGYSMKHLAECWQWHRTTVENFLTDLTEREMIDNRAATEPTQTRMVRMQRMRTMKRTDQKRRAHLRYAML